MNTLERIWEFITEDAMEWVWGFTKNHPMPGWPLLIVAYLIRGILAIVFLPPLAIIAAIWGKNGDIRE